MPGIAVYCHRGRPPAPPRDAIEVDVGSWPPCAFTGLRRVLEALRSEAPDIVGRAAERHPAEWRELFPGDPAASSVPALHDIAGSPSARLLDGESEWAFRVLQAAADALVAAVAELDRPLILRNCGAADLVSLRGVMRAVELSRCGGAGGLVVCGEWEVAAGRRPPLFDRLRERMCAPLEGQTAAPPAAATQDCVPDSTELHLLRAAIDADRPPAERLAAALHAVRACLVSTNHEGALLACDAALRLLRDQPRPSAAEVADALAAMDGGATAPAMDIDAEIVAGRAADLEALFWRSAGVAHSFIGEGAAAIEAFRHALAAGPSPLAEAAVRTCLGRQLGKEDAECGAAELRRGLALVEADPAPEATIAEGWLRGALALGALRQRRVRDASEELVRALRRVADRHDASATNLKLELMGGLSLLHETARRHADAIRMWHRYLELSSDWGDRFLEHYAYREGGLHLVAGEEDAVLCQGQAFRRAAALGDAFHGAAIAAELGGHHLAAGRPAEALSWFAAAIDLGRQAGDPHRVGEAMAGAALAGGEPDPRAAAAMLRLTMTRAEPALALALAIETGDREAQLAALPRPRTTLRRPFDLIAL